MRNPIQWIMTIAGGSLAVAACLLLSGHLLEKPALKTAAHWLWGLAFLTAAMPMLLFICMLLLERIRRR